MKIGEVAQQLNMPSSTIRYYEKKGLIPPPERVSGQREFSQQTLMTLRFVQLCQAAGFTIGEIHTLLENPTDESNADGLWQAAVAAKRKDVAQQMQDLKQIDSVLDALAHCRCESIEECVGQALTDERWSRAERG